MANQATADFIRTCTAPATPEQLARQLAEAQANEQLARAEVGKLRAERAAIILELECARESLDRVLSALHNG